MIVFNVKTNEGKEFKKNSSLIHIENFPISYHPGIMSCVRIYITSKQIELESPGWSGFVKNSKPDKT